MKFNNYLFILLSWVATIAFSCKKIIKTEYYKDFDYINVKGIDIITKHKVSFPYVEMNYYEDSSIGVVFRLDKNKSRKKVYQKQNEMLTSRFSLGYHDAGCNGFTYVEFYFAPNKMITYQFCKKADFDKKEKVYTISTEEWLNNNYDHHSISTVPNSFDNPGAPFLFTFNPVEDFNSSIFTREGAFINESSDIQEGDSLINRMQTYYIEKDNGRKYIANLRFPKPIKNSAVSIWKRFENIY